jgi:hypothetical protein
MLRNLLELAALRNGKCSSEFVMLKTAKLAHALAATADSLIREAGETMRLRTPPLIQHEV